MSEPLVTGAEILARIDRLVAGKDAIETDEPPILDAGKIPYWYGVQTADEVCTVWLRMWDGVKARYPRDEAFYLSNAIGWASR